MNHRSEHANPASENGPTPIRVLLVDDQQLVREGLRALLATEPGIVVVGEADATEAAIAACRNSPPDVVLVDSMLPEMEAPDLIREIRARHPQVQFIAVAECPEVQCGVLHPGAIPMHHCLLLEAGATAPADCLELAVLAGARGAIRKTSSREELLQAIRAVAPGRYWTELTTALRVIDHLQHPAPSPPEPLRSEKLTRRQLQVIRELVSGGSNKQIGHTLGLSEQAVKNTISRILALLSLEDRVQLALYAVNTRLLERHAGLLARE